MLTWRSPQEERSRALAIGDHRTISAALAGTGLGHALLDQIAAEINLDQASLGIGDGRSECLVADPLAPLEVCERLRLVDPHGRDTAEASMASVEYRPQPSARCNLIPEAAVAGLALERHPGQHCYARVDVVVDDDLALGMVLAVQAAHILGERAPP